MEKKLNNLKDLGVDISNKISGNSKALPIEEINKVKSTSEMHFDGISTYYSLNEHEFETIKRGTNSIWKELTITSVALFIPLLTNTVTEGMRTNWTDPSWDLFFNGLFTLTSFILIICFGIAWYNSKNEMKIIIDRIEKKPKFKI
ncbi:hypothetical protein [uncultured Dokdonia sp.]|uniref:hypothetical protein n=1 Tax=uncultured Dokdonia sp. TaxID=575653 RepID=UPI002621FF6E|nr:hypothetical protein [uncultured Dokdonia sp.]